MRLFHRSHMHWRDTRGLLLFVSLDLVLTIGNAAQTFPQLATTTSISGTSATTKSKAITAHEISIAGLENTGQIAIVCACPVQFASLF